MVCDEKNISYRNDSVIVNSLISLFELSYSRIYIYEDLVLSNNIRTLWIMTQDNVDLLAQIDADIVAWNGLTWWWSIDRGVPLWDNNWWYGFINTDRTQQLLLRAQVQKVWRIENPLSITCEWPWCPQPWWWYIFDMIIHDVKPIHIVDRWYYNHDNRRSYNEIDDIE